MKGITEVNIFLFLLFWKKSSFEFYIREAYSSSYQYKNNMSPLYLTMQYILKISSPKHAILG